MINYKQKHIEHVRATVLNDLEVLDDGYKVWWPLHGHGYMNSFDLRVVADYLDELNKDWDEQVKRDVG